MTSAQNAHMRDMRYRWGTEGRCTRCGTFEKEADRAVCKKCRDYIRDQRARRRARARAEKFGPPPRSTPKTRKTPTKTKGKKPQAPKKRAKK